MTLLLIMLGGALGAALRFLVDSAVTARTGRALPWGTLSVNVAGSFLLGGLVGAADALPGWLGSFGGVGFCGALTTYSTFSYETLQLAESGSHRRALLNVVTMLLTAVPAGTLGWLVGVGLTG